MTELDTFMRSLHLRAAKTSYQYPRYAVVSRASYNKLAAEVEKSCTYAKREFYDNPFKIMDVEVLTKSDAEAMVRELMKALAVFGEEHNKPKVAMDVNQVSKVS